MGNQFFIRLFSLNRRQVIDITIMKSARHAILHAARVAVAKIAFGGDLSLAFKMNISKWAGSHTHFAADAGGFVHPDGMGFRVANKSLGGTDFQAEGCFTLQARHGKNGTFFKIDLDPDV
jgi:hypothetical protein